jgi:2-oxoglutarate ferredoxin oxidoreductase subunit alpha
VHYLDGDYACGEGAMAAGCRFVAGYPITPSTEVVERISQRFPVMGGTFIQMEDELASMAAVAGGAWTGTKCMTVTSGPGFSLMMENIGLATMMEAPCVVVNVQRGGPSTGLPTMVGQADMMQARWGSHGDYELIALSPQSPQEAFDLTIDAFNLSETWRVPVMFMMDECVGHMTEKVVIPPADEIDIVPRKLTDKKPGEYKPYEVNGRPVPEMARAGDGHRFHTTGLTHDERGYPAMTVECQEESVRRLMDKIRLNADQIIRIEEEDVEGADVVVVAYGSRKSASGNWRRRSRPSWFRKSTTDRWFSRSNVVPTARHRRSWCPMGAAGCTTRLTSARRSWRRPNEYDIQDHRSRRASDRPLPADGSDAPHLVSHLRYRNYRQVLRHSARRVRHRPRQDGDLLRNRLHGACGRLYEPGRVSLDSRTRHTLRHRSQARAAGAPGRGLLR